MNELCNRKIPARDCWIYRPKKNAEIQLKLICFHYAGGSAQIYRQWGEAFDPVAETLAVQLPGRADRFGEPPFLSMNDLVAELVLRLEPMCLGPVVFFGHSLGGLIAFEVARALQSRSRGPAALLVSAKSPPQFDRFVQSVHLLSDDELLREMKNRYKGAPSMELLEEPELRRMFLSIIRADMTLLETYVFLDGPPLDLPVIAIGGDEDPLVPLEGLKGWQLYTSRKIEIWPFPGGHFFWQKNATPLLGKMRDYLKGL